MQRDGLFIGHGGARHDMNADVAESFLVALYPAWSAFFEGALPALIRQLQAYLVAGTERALTDLGATPATAAAVHSRFFEREALALIDRERVEIIGAVIEALREELRDDYRSLLQADEPLTKQRSCKGRRRRPRETNRTALRVNMNSIRGGAHENLGAVVNAR